MLFLTEFLVTVVKMLFIAGIAFLGGFAGKKYRDHKNAKKTDTKTL